MISHDNAYVKSRILNGSALRTSFGYSAPFFYFCIASGHIAFIDVDHSLASTPPPGTLTILIHDLFSTKTVPFGVATRE